MSDDAKYRPFVMSRFLSVFHCEAEAERDGNLIYLWEPLHYTTELTAEDRPSWEYEHVTFYRPAHKDWVRVQRHLMFNQTASPTVVMLHVYPPGPCAGACVEITGAQVHWRGDRWFVRWHGYTNSRAAKMVKAGIEWYVDSDREMPVRRDDR